MPRSVHLARSWVALASRLGADAGAPLDPAVPIGDDEAAVARARLSTEGLEGARSIALCPGATYGPTKRWPEHHWMALGRRLLEDGWSLALLGGADERDLCEAIAGGVAGSGRAVNLAGRMSLRQSLATLACLAAAVSNDSGGMHLASAAGIPVLGIFGSTDPAWTGPLGERSRALTLRLGCSPCFLKACPTKIECLWDLEPERVHRSLSEMIA
jgi:heptosyltransferase-2